MDEGRFSPDVTTAKLMYRKIAKRDSWEFDSIIIYAKLERHFAIGLYTNVAVSSRDCKARIRRIALTLALGPMATQKKLRTYATVLK